MTTARVRVLAALLEANSPLNAADVCRRLRGVKADRVTIYRTLNTLVSAGILHRIDPGDRIFRFGLTGGEVKDAGAGRRHPHFVCDACGTVQCLADSEVTVTPKPRPERAGGAVPSGGGGRPLRVTQQDVLLHGTCGDCGEDTKPRNTSGGHRGRAGRR